MVEKLRKLFSEGDRTGAYLLLAGFLLAVFLIIFSNSGILPFARTGDFLFLTVIFLLFALYRPSWGFVVFLAVSCLENIRMSPEILGLTLRPYQLAGILTLTAVVMLVLLKKTALDIPKPGRVGWLALVLVVGGFISVLAANDPAASFKQALVLLSFVLLGFLVRIFVRDWQDIRKIAPFYIAGGVATLGYAIWQSWRFTHGLADFAAMSGRPNATYTEPDWLGLFIVFFLAVAYVGLEFGLKKSSRLGIAAFSLLIWGNLTVLILTVARSAWIGAAAVSLAYLAIVLTGLRINIREWDWRRSSRVALIIVAATVMSYGSVRIFNLTNFELFSRAESAGTGLQKITVACEAMRCSGGERCHLPETVGSLEELAGFGCRHIDLEDIEAERRAGYVVTEIYRPDPNIGIRGRIFRQSWELIKSSPVLGIGWGSAGKFLGKDERGVELNSSNIFIEIWLGSGLIGISAWLGLIFLAVRSGFRNILSGDEDSYLWGVLKLLGLAAILIPNLFNAGLLLGYVWIFLALI